MPRRGERGREEDREGVQGGERGGMEGGVFVSGDLLSGCLAVLEAKGCWTRKGAGREREQLRRNGGD